MKVSSLLATLSIGLMVVTSGCGNNGNDAATPAELQLERLVSSYTTSASKTWTVSEVFFDGTENRTGDWTGFAITLSSTGGVTGTHSYSTTGGLSGGPWPPIGSWEFGGTVDNPNINQIIREDNLEIAVTVSDNELTMTFIFDNAIHTSGRVDAVNGEYSFTFSSN